MRTPRPSTTNQRRPPLPVPIPTPSRGPQPRDLKSCPGGRRRMHHRPDHDRSCRQLHSPHSRDVNPIPARVASTTRPGRRVHGLGPSAAGTLSTGPPREAAARCGTTANVSTRFRTFPDQGVRHGPADPLRTVYRRRSRSGCCNGSDRLGPAGADPTTPSIPRANGHVRLLVGGQFAPVGRTRFLRDQWTREFRVGGHETAD